MPFAVFSRGTLNNTTVEYYPFYFIVKGFSCLLQLNTDEIQESGLEMRGNDMLL